MAGKPSVLTYDGTAYASGIVYNPASQVTELKVGDNIMERYTYDAKTGFISNQKVIRDEGQPTARTLMNLTYNYLREGTTVGRTGQLTKITDHLNQQRNRNYEYDAPGRLKEVTGGVTTAIPAGLWTQTYSYDKWGNRTNVVMTSDTANYGSGMVRDGLGALAYNGASNRVITSGWTYDSAGNQTRAKNSVIRRHCSIGRMLLAMLPAALIRALDGKQSEKAK